MRVSEKYCPWIDKNLKNLMRTRDKLKRAAIKRKSPILMDSYRQTRNRVNLLNKQLRKQHYTNKISSNKGNLKDSWKTINELLNKRSKSCNIDCVKDSDSVVTRTEDIANVMNSYFCSIATELANEIDHSSNPLLSGEYHINDKSEKFNFRPINVQDIRDGLAKAKISKSFGHDNISYFFLKLALPYIENSLAILFNTSIETSIFRDSWKLARVTPIFKEGDKDDKSNYRPISVLPAISRLFEKLTTDQLYQFMEKNGLFSTDQSGFLRQHSTLTSLLKSTDDWYRGLDLGKLVGMVFIDLRKAFDTVDHSILCQKLKHYGIRKRELSWFKSYLSNRKQFCRVSGTDSNVNDVTIGVPQGSCLGPLLFLIYINDLPLAFTNSNTSMYADDTSICYHSHEITRLNEAINNDLYKLDKWLE